MSDTAALSQDQLPGTADIRKIVAVLREDLTSAVRAEAADRLVILAGSEPHPVAKSAMLERAARLVLDDDAERAMMLLREAFRLHPQSTVGELLRDNGLDDDSMARLGRAAALMDSVAALATDADDRRGSLFAAARYHLGEGCGHRAAATVELLRAAGVDERSEELEELASAATALVDERQGALAQKRGQIGTADEADRGRVLFEYAELLLSGDEPLSDASAVLADAIEAGVDVERAAPVWAEVARAVGEPEMLGRALAACLARANLPHERLRFADELANVSGVEESNPALLRTALQTLSEAMPDDLALRGRWLASRAHGGDAGAETELDSLRRTAVKNRDRHAEASICLALARIAGRRDDAKAAERHLRRVRTLDPRNVEALDFFERRYREADDGERLYVVLTHRLAISHGEVALKIALEMAHMADGPPVNVERAVEAYERILAVAPEHPEALQRLEALYRDSERWAAICDMLDRRARPLERTDDPAIRDQAVPILERLAELYRPDAAQPDPTALLDVWTRIHDADPSHRQAAEQLADRYRRDGRWRRLALVLQARLDHESDAQARPTIAHELYDLYRNRLGDGGRAVKSLESLVADKPDDLDSLRLLQDAYQRGGDDAAYLGVLARIRNLVDGDEKVAVLETMSALAENNGDAASAIDLYLALDEVKPGHMAARRALTRLYRDQGRHAELADLLDRRIKQESLDREERAELYELLAKVSVAHLDDMKRAEKAARSLRKIKPDSQIGSDIAERAMIARGDFAGLRKLFGDDAESAERYVATLLKVAAERSDTIGARCLLSAAAAIDGELRDPSAAAETAGRALQAALELDDGDAVALDAARATLMLAESAGHAELQLLAVSALIDRVQGGELRLHMARRVALFEALQDYDGAFSAVSALLSARVADGDLQDIDGAADRAVDLAERTGQDEDLPLLLCTWAAAVIEQLGTDGNDDVRRDAAGGLLQRALELALVLGDDLGEIREQLNGLLTHGETVELLQLHEQVSTEQGDWVAVVDALEKQAALAAPDQQAALLLRAAARAESAGQAKGRAASLYRRVTGLAPDSVEAWSGLVESSRAAGDDDALAATLDAFLAAPVADRAAKAAASIERVGQLMDADAGAAALNAVLTPILAVIADSDSLVDAESGVLAIAAGRLELEDGAVDLARALLPAARRHGQMDAVLRCHELLVSDDASGQDGAGRLLDMATIALSELNDRPRALGHLKAALVAAPADAGAWTRIAATLEDDDERATIGSAILALVGAGGDPDVAELQDIGVRAGLLRRWAEDAQGRDDADVALQAWTLLRAEEPASVDALDALEMLYREQADHDAVAFILRDRLAAITDPDDRESTWIRLVGLHADDRDDSEQASATLAEAVADAPSSDTLWALHIDALRAGAPATLIAAIEARIQQLSVDDELGRSLRSERAGLLAAAGDHAGALAAWHELLQADPTDDDAAAAAFAALQALGPLPADQLDLAAAITAAFAVREEHERVDAALTARVAASADDLKLELIRAQLDLRENLLKDSERAFASASAGLLLAPQDEALYAAAERLASPDDAGAKLALMQARANAQQEPARRVELLLEHAIAADDAGQRTQAAESWRVLLDIGDEQAQMLAAATLAEIYEELGDATRYAEALLAQRDLAEDDDARVALGVMAAEQLAEAGAFERAVEVLAVAQSLAPKSTPVWMALRTALVGHGDRAALSAHLDRGWRDVLQDADARADAATTLAQALADDGATDAERWQLLCDVLSAGVQADALLEMVDALSDSDDDAVALPALDRRISGLVARGEGELAVMLRVQRLGRFGEQLADALAERKAVATALEAEVNDAESALAQWLQVIAAAPSDSDAVGAALRLADATDAVAETEAFIAEAAQSAAGAAGAAPLNMQLAERCVARGDAPGALVRLDSVLSASPAHAEAFVMRGAALSALKASAARDERITQHLRHGLAHLEDDGERRAALLQLADHLADAQQDPRAAFDLIATELGRPDAADREDLHRLAELYGEVAEITEPLWDLLQAEAATATGDMAAERWLALAHRCAAVDPNSERTCAAALAALDAGARDALALLDAAHSAAETPDPALTRTLIDAYTVADPARALTLVRAVAQAAQDTAERLAAWTEWVAVATSEAGVAASVPALDGLIQLALLEPAAPARWQAALQAAGEVGAGDVLAAGMQAYDEAEDPALKHALLRHCAAAAQATGDAEGAAGYLRMALEEQDRDETRVQLHELLRASGEHAALAVELQAAADASPDKRVVLLERALGVWLDNVGDAERGMEVLDTLLKLVPERLDLADRRLDVMRLSGHDGYADALQDALANAREHDDKPRLAGLIARLLVARADDLAADARFSLLAELASVSASTAALATFVDVMAADADELAPDQARTVLGWQRDNTDKAAEPDKWAAIRARELDLEADDGAQLLLLDELVGHALDVMRDREQAEQWACRALLLDPTNDGRALELVAFAEGGPDAPAVSALQVTIESRGDKQAAPVELYAALLRLAPDDEESLRLALDRCTDAAFCAALAEQVGAPLREAGAHAAAVAVDRALINHLAPDERGDALVRLAASLATDLGQPAVALNALISAAGALPDPGSAVAAALEIAREHGLLHEWLDALDVAIADRAITGEGAVLVAALGAGVASDDLSDPARAAELWTRIWDAAPNNEDARDAVLALRREAGDAEQLSADLERAAVRGGAGAQDLNVELAALCHTELGRSSEALAKVRTVLRAEPGREDAIAVAEQLARDPACASQALTLLATVYRGAERWPQLVDVLERRAVAGRGRKAARDYATLAAVQRDHLQDAPKALQSYIAALELAPTGQLLECALQLVGDADSDDQRAHLYELALSDKLPSDERPEVLAAAAAFQRDVRDDPTTAERLWQELLTIAPSHPGAYEGLDAVYEQADRWDDLLALLDKRIAHARDTGDEQAILHRLGGIAQAVQRNDVAIDAYQRLARLDPDDTEHLATAVELLRSAQDPRRLAVCLQELAEAVDEPSESAKALTEAAHLWDKRLDDSAAAEKLFLKAFDADPGAEEAFTWLERRHADDPGKLQKLYRHRTRGVQEGPARTRVLRKLASVYSDAGKSAQARAALTKARETDPDNDAIDEDLLVLCAAHGDDEGYEEAAGRRLARPSLPKGERLALLESVARRALARGDSAERWVNELREAGGDEAVIGGLDAIARAHSDDPAVAAEGLERVARDEKDPKALMSVLEELADLYGGPLDNPQRAIATYQRILRMDPHRATIQRKLADLFRGRGSHEAHVETLRKWLSTTPEGIAQAPILAELAGALLQAGRDRQALVTLEKAHDLDPANLDVNARLARMLANEDQRPRAAELQKTVVDALRRDRKPELAAAATFAGELYEQIDEAKDAQRFFRMALRADRDAHDASLGLARVMLSSGDPQRALTEFEKVAVVTDGRATPEQLAAAHIGLGRCWMAQGKRTHARNAFNKALVLEPGNKTALHELTTL